jgi:transcriptional regulator with XRE-family HTH domain
MSGWDAGLDDDEAGAVMKTVGRQLKLWREAAGLTQAEFGTAIGYGEELVSSVERGRRIPRAEYLEGADKVLNAGGRIAAMRKDVAEARYPKKVRDLAKLEAQALELGAYNNSVVHGLLQTKEYGRAVFEQRRPPFTADELEQRTTARLARQNIVTRAAPQPVLSFVQCESSLRRPVGGRDILRGQLEKLLEVAQLPNVEIQVLPLSTSENPGLSGPFRLLRLNDGTTIGHVEIQHFSRVVTDPRDVQLLDMRYGAIRAQALTPRESANFIEKILGET